MSFAQANNLREKVFHEILTARQRVYDVHHATPLEEMENTLGARKLFIKREDLSPIHAYKWRGAYNRIASLNEAERAQGVITASAGNHAQGVALAAKRLEIRATIVMPLSTPKMKQLAVRRHGGDFVDVKLIGDSYSDAEAAALQMQKELKLTFVHPYNDLETMGGQGTLADEIVMSGKGPIDVAFLQIGGGGMAAASAVWLKHYYPNIRLIGVEGVDQACMKAAIEAGQPTALNYLDVFCDGTAVRKAGQNTFELCRDLLDEIVTVTNEEVCAAIQLLFESKRVIAEPAGAMGLAAAMKFPEKIKGQNVVTILCGSNIDFGQLAWVARHAGIGSRHRRYYRFEIGERPGTMLSLIETALDGCNIIEFQYGKVSESKAFPVIGFDASPEELTLLHQRLNDLGIPHEDVTSNADIDFRLIRYRADLFQMPFLMNFEFPERAGALREFLRAIAPVANLCYLNYVYTGERVGRALIGLEFVSQDNRDAFLKLLSESDWNYRELEKSVADRIYAAFN